jgi:hypothetical protein
VCERGLPEKERRTAGASLSVSQDAVGSMSVQEEQEPPSNRSRCIDGWNQCDLIHTWAREMMEDMAKEGPEWLHG